MTDFSSLSNYGYSIPSLPLPNAMAGFQMPSYTVADTSALASPADFYARDAQIDPGEVASAMSQNTGSSGRGSMFGGLFDNFFNKTDKNGISQQGWGGLALGAAQGLGNLYLGMQQYGLAKDALANARRQFDINYGAQKKLTNANLEDRQRARVASNSGAYQSVGDYMAKNGL